MIAQSQCISMLSKKGGLGTTNGKRPNLEPPGSFLEVKKEFLKAWKRKRRKYKN